MLALRQPIAFVAAPSGGEVDPKSLPTVRALAALANNGMLGEAQLEQGQAADAERAGLDPEATKRGTVVDLKALAGHMKSGHVAGAAIDVFPEEPEGNTDGFATDLQGLSNVVLTPHIASNTEETMRAMGECLLDNMRSWFAGRGAVTPVA